MSGLMKSLANAYHHLRFNIVAPGLIKDSRVHAMMKNTCGNDYIEEKHASKMHGQKLVDVVDVVDAIMMTIENSSIASATINVDRGMIS
jgi:NAD(P)-dependent dehydrogenase (short-subunit alcohol dehydrogenase family)